MVCNVDTSQIQSSQKVSGFNDVCFRVSVQVRNVSRNSSHNFRSAVKINKTEPVQSYFCITDVYISRFNEILVNPIFCDEIFEVFAAMLVHFLLKMCNARYSPITLQRNAPTL